MIRPEFYKIRHHRTPWVILGIGTLLVLAAPVYYAIRPPVDPSEVLSTTNGVFALVAAFLAPVFGSWIVGHEYRQGTLRRVLAIDARRPRLLGIKGAVGAAALSAGLATVACIGIASSYVAAQINGGTTSLDGSGRELLAAGFFALVSAAIAYSLSIILRSDTYAMLGAIAFMVIFGPLLALIPTVGDYTPYATANVVSSWITAVPTDALSTGTAAATLAATLAATFAVATALFSQRDI